MLKSRKEFTRSIKQRFSKKECSQEENLGRVFVSAVPLLWDGEIQYNNSQQHQPYILSSIDRNKCSKLLEQ